MSNPSKKVMRRSVERHLTNLERMREFDRGYQAGRAAMSAEHNMLRQSCKNGDNCKVEASESFESSKSVENCKSGHSRTCPESGDEVSESAPSASITDELREFKGHINAGLTPEMVLALRAEINCIADRIEEQFARICEQQEAVLQSTIEDNVDYDDLYAAAASFAGCDECGKYKQHMYQEFEKRIAVEQERDELQAKLNELDVSGATILYKLLKATLGEAKNAADSLVVARKSRSMLEDELRRKTAEAQGLRHECSTYRDMLLIASDELGSIKKHLDEIMEVLDGRD